MQVKNHSDVSPGIFGRIKLLIQRRDWQAFDIVSWLVITLGIALRLRQYLANRSLWVDEASLALNIINRSFSGLTHPLDYNQGAPIGFLFLEKLATLILGNSEYSLRLFPLISGLLSVYLIYRITSEHLGNVGLFALILIAISPTLIYYSSELKQYSSDVMVSLLLLYLSIYCYKENASARSYVLLSLAGVTAIWVSHPSIFVLAGIGLVLLVEKLIEKNRSQLIWVAGTGITWLSMIGLSYYLSLRSLTENEYLNDYWVNHFLPLPPWDHLEWYKDVFSSLLESITPNPDTALVTGICFLLALMGIMVGIRQNTKFALTTLLPFVMAATASAFHLYPLSGRFLLFLVPFVILFLAAGIRWLYSIIATWNRNIALFLYGVTVIALTWSSVSTSFQNLINPPMGEHIRPVLAYIETNIQEGDTVYVFSGSVTPFRYYANSYHLDTTNTIVAENSSGVKRFVQDIEELKGRDRVWFIFSHVIGCGDCEGDKVQFHAHLLDEYGRREDEFHAPGADVFLYDLTQ